MNEENQAQKGKMTVRITDKALRGVMILLRSQNKEKPELELEPTVVAPQP